MLNVLMEVAWSALVVFTGYILFYMVKGIVEEARRQ